MMTVLSEDLAAVRAFLLARCRDGDLAADLAQEVAVRLAAADGRLEQEHKGYAIRTAHNVWRDWLRRELVRRRAEPLIAADAAEAPAADAAMVERELVEALRQAIASLPQKERDVVELRHREGITFREIAGRLGRPLGTVLGQMRSALSRLHTVMEPYR